MKKDPPSQKSSQGRSYNVRHLEDELFEESIAGALQLHDLSQLLGSVRGRGATVSGYHISHPLPLGDHSTQLKSVMRGMTRSGILGRSRGGAGERLCASHPGRTGLGGQNAVGKNPLQ